MIPYLILGGAGALALALGTRTRRKRHADPRTAETRRIRAIDSRYAITRRMSKVNPSPERTRRIQQAMRETNALIGKEMRYSPDLRKKAYLKTLRDHLAKLQKMLTHSNPKGLIGVDSSGIRWSVKKNSDTREWMVVAYVNGKRDEDKTYYTDDKSDAVGTFNHLMTTRGGKVTNPRRNPDWRSGVPSSYKSRAGRRLGRDLTNGLGPVQALGVARIVARQGGDHVALNAIDAVIAELKNSPSMKYAEAEIRAWELARMLGSTKHRRNPKRRSKKRGKKKAKAPKHFVRTTTHTVKTVQHNPKRRSKKRRR